MKGFHIAVTQNPFLCLKSCVLWVCTRPHTRSCQPLAFMMSPWFVIADYHPACSLYDRFPSLGNLHKDPRPLPTPTFLTQYPPWLIFSVWQDHGLVIHSPTKESHDTFQILAMNRAAITVQVGPIPLVKPQELHCCITKECLVNCYWFSSKSHLLDGMATEMVRMVFPPLGPHISAWHLTSGRCSWPAGHMETLPSVTATERPTWKEHSWLKVTWKTQHSGCCSHCRVSTSSHHKGSWAEPHWFSIHCPQ
jgi:hypothetical protein